MRSGSGLSEDEDCLTLNVWTAAGTDLPVLVWIHGGRFAVGSSADPTFDGTALASRGVSVVSMNYRLGAMGFLAHPDLSAESDAGSSGNYGLLDQIAALRWVQQNIAHFGGDPTNVTIAGQSAGAACVLHLMNSPLAVGLFQRVVALSGARHPGDPAIDHLAPAYRSRHDAERDGAAFVASFGESSIDDLRRLPWDLVARDADTSVPGKTPPRFRPVLDGLVMTGTYDDALSHPRSAVPVLTGTTHDEDGASPHPTCDLAAFQAYATATFGDSADEFLRLYPAATDREAARQRNAAARDGARSSTWLWAMTWSTHARVPVYTSFWNHVPPGPAGVERGAHHESELPYLFDNPAPEWDQSDRRISDTLAAYLTGFVRCGDPNGEGRARWEPATSAVARTMELGDRWRAIDAADPEKMAFWQKYFESGERR